jgi:hypothetical protein
MNGVAVFCTLLAIAGAACGGSRTEGLDPSTVPDDLRGDYAIFAQRCSKCHSLARPLAAGITDDGHWELYVTRMRRQPASGISLDDQKHILNFLHWRARELRSRESEKDRPEVGPPPSRVASEPTPPPANTAVGDAAPRDR